MDANLKQVRRTATADTREHEVLAHDEPTEEAQKSYHTVLEQHVRQAAEELERPAAGLFLSSLSAGLDIGFGPLLMAVIASSMSTILPRPVIELLMALGYTIGFVLVVIGRSALFTEQTTSAVLPVLAKRSTIASIFRLWSIVLIGNLIGGTLIAAFIGIVAPRLGIVAPAELAAIAHKLLAHEWWLMLLSAVAAGWLMGLLAWLVIASRDTISQITIVVATTFIIGIAGLHHSIAGSIEILMAIFAGEQSSIAPYGVFLLWTVVGNALGGVVFVALLKFGHVRASST